MIVIDGIAHDNVFKIDAVIKKFSEMDGVPITYVCTSEIGGNNMPCDVFYRETPHPEFGNRYFALVSRGSVMFIMNADTIENEQFACISDKSGNLHYSQYRHDYRQVDDCAIDGGRAYSRIIGGKNGGFPDVTYFKVVNGQMVADECQTRR